MLEIIVAEPGMLIGADFGPERSATVHFAGMTLGALAASLALS
jgi:hypothetical protein